MVYAVLLSWPCGYSMYLNGSCIVTRAAPALRPLRPWLDHFFKQNNFFNEEALEKWLALDRLAANFSCIFAATYMGWPVALPLNSRCRPCVAWFSCRNIWQGKSSNYKLVLATSLGTCTTATHAATFVHATKEAAGHAIEQMALSGNGKEAT